MEEFDTGREAKFNKRGGQNKERGVSQKVKINKCPPRLFGTLEYLAGILLAAVPDRWFSS